MAGRFDTDLDTDSLNHGMMDVSFASLKEKMGEASERNVQKLNTEAKEGPKFKLVKIYETEDFQLLTKLARQSNVSVNALVTNLIHNFVEENKDKLRMGNNPSSPKGRFDLGNIEGFENLERYSMMEKLLEVQALEDAKAMDGIDLEDIPDAPNSSDDEEDEGPERRDNDI